MKNLFVRTLTVVALAACSYGVFAQDMPTPEQRDAVHACMEKAGIPKPTPGQGKPDLTPEQKQAAQKCFKDNGVQPPAGKMNP